MNNFKRIYKKIWNTCCLKEISDYENNKKSFKVFPDLMYCSDLTSIINKESISEISKLSITEYFWSIRIKLNTAMIPFRQFFNIFKSIYDIYFPKILVRLKPKHIQSPYITKIANSSKRKQKLYKILLKHRTRETESAYKSYKNLF